MPETVKKKRETHPDIKRVRDVMRAVEMLKAAKRAADKAHARVETADSELDALIDAAPEAQQPYLRSLLNA